MIACQSSYHQKYGMPGWLLPSKPTIACYRFSSFSLPGKCCYGLYRLR